MDLHNFQAFSPMKSPSILASSSSVHSSSSSHSGFPIIAVAIIGILATGFLLVSYYIFVIKCCLNWHRIDLLRRFSFSRRRPMENPLMRNSPAVENRGLDESIIRSIPIFQYKKSIRKNEEKQKSCCECAVCLNEFQEEEKLRIMPNCAHVFHIDCIDIWLQNNANCPLCRNSISANNSGFTLDQIMAPISSSPQDPNRNRNGDDNFTGRDEDYVVIEIGEELSTISISPSPRKLESKVVLSHSQQKKKKKLNHISSMGDECIDIRQKDEQFFAIQPIRRSISMDSAADPQLYLAVQQIMQQQQQQQRRQISPSEGSSSSSRIKRSFFSFGHGKGSRSAVLPVPLEP